MQGCSGRGVPELAGHLCWQGAPQEVSLRIRRLGGAGSDCPEPPHTAPGAGVAAFSCKAGEFLDMKAQACQPCAEGTYSLGTGVRFDEWDEVPHGFANVATNLEVDDGFGDVVENCTA